MKKIIALALALAAGFAMAACGAQGGDYKDGDYLGSYEAMDSHGWRPQMEIVVKGGKIESVRFDYLNKDDGLKTADEAYNANMMKFGGKTNPAKAYPELSAALVKAQKAPVDAVTGATSSSANFNALAAAILAKAKAGDATMTVLPMDETYVAFDAVDERGYTGVISVSYAGGKIAAVEYEEYKADIKAAADIKADLGSKRTDAAYNASMAEKSKVSWVEAAGKLETAAVAGGSGSAVDAVSGATGLSARFNALLAKAVALR